MVVIKSELYILEAQNWNTKWGITAIVAELHLCYIKCSSWSLKMDHWRSTLFKSMCLLGEVDNTKVNERSMLFMHIKVLSIIRYYCSHNFDFKGLLWWHALNKKIHSPRYQRFYLCSCSIYYIFIQSTKIIIVFWWLFLGLGCRRK